MTAATILAALLALGAPTATASNASSAIYKYSRSADEAAFLVALGMHETRFEARLIDGDCKPWECDHGAARGAFQLHRGAAGADWELLPGNIDAQARSAVRMVRWAFRVCKTPVGAFRALGGLGCDRPLKGEEKRMASFLKARSML